MNKKFLTILWASLFIVCAGLGFIPERSETLQVLMTLLSLIFFLPPVLMLMDAGRMKDRDTIRLLRNLSALSLGLTVVLLILNFLTVFTSETLGLVLHYVLITVSSPMICSGSWALSLFLWACLLTASGKQLKM